MTEDNADKLTDEELLELFGKSSENAGYLGATEVQERDAISRLPGALLRKLGLTSRTSETLLAAMDDGGQAVGSAWANGDALSFLADGTSWFPPKTHAVRAGLLDRLLRRPPGRIDHPIEVAWRREKVGFNGGEIVKTHVNVLIHRPVPSFVMWGSGEVGRPGRGGTQDPTPKLTFKDVRRKVAELGGSGARRKVHEALVDAGHTRVNRIYFTPSALAEPLGRELKQQVDDLLRDGWICLF
jgi:hypothetical protein